MLLAGCAGAGPAPVHHPETPVWEIPAAALGSQRLYRVTTSGTQGEGSFRLSLLLASPERYQVRAVDPVGRALWTLDVEAERGLFLDHRSSAYCVFEGRFDLSGVPLAPFPLMSLPALLLERVPGEPAAPPRQSGREVAFADAGGRRWTATLDGGRVASWTVWDGETPAYLWVRRGDWAILSDRRQGVQVRWRQVLSEPLAAAPAVLAPPEGFRAGDCRPAPAGAGG